MSDQIDDDIQSAFSSNQPASASGPAVDKDISDAFAEPKSAASAPSAPISLFDAIRSGRSLQEGPSVSVSDRVNQLGTLAKQFAGGTIDTLADVGGAPLKVGPPGAFGIPTLVPDESKAHWASKSIGLGPEPDQNASLNLVRMAGGAMAPLPGTPGADLPRSMEDLRAAVGPSVTSSSAVEHGDTLIDAYRAKDAAAQADISAKYQAVEAANGGKSPLDAVQLDDNVTQALHSKYLYEHAPTAELKQLSDASKNGSMSMEQFEAMRTNLAGIMRSSRDANEVRAAGVIRDEMEKLPLTGGAAQTKQLADTARSAARDRFQAMEADPAYKAAVNGTVSPDTFVHKFITGPSATRDGVSAMRSSLADNENATQTMGVAALDKLNELKNPTNAYKQLQPKLDSLMEPEHQAALDSIVKAKTATPGPIRKFAARSAPAVGALIGGHALGAPGALGGELAGESVGRRLLGQ